MKLSVLRLEDLAEITYRNLEDLAYDFGLSRANNDPGVTRACATVTRHIILIKGSDYTSPGIAIHCRGSRHSAIRVARLLSDNVTVSSK